MIAVCVHIHAEKRIADPCCIDGFIDWFHTGNPNGRSQWIAWIDMQRHPHIMAKGFIVFPT